jgi:hypothetical protein
MITPTIATIKQRTYLDQSFPWGLYRGGAALCPDGKVRKLKRIATTADTFFSIPASVTVRGRTVAGYVTVKEAVVEFHPYLYRKNHSAFCKEVAR